MFDFLQDAEHQRLLDWTIAMRERFEPATVTKGRAKDGLRVNPKTRIALTTRDIGPLEDMLKKRLLDALPELMVTTGIRGEPPASLELELAAHGDGAFFAPHLDIPVGAHRQPLGARQGEDRILSAVYYYYAEPKAFTGGELRLFPFGPAPSGEEQSTNHVDIEPVRNCLVAFPSWVPHEVRPVRCPSAQFEDYRFAVNCWYCRSLNSSSE